jgi:large subunit ribosomal protein L24
MKTKYVRPAQNRRAKRETPYHQRKKDFNVHLSSDLRKKYGIRSLPVRKDDTVLIMRGKFSGLQKRVAHVSLKKRKVQIEGVKMTKTDGTEIFFWLEPSNLLLTNLGKIDDGRKKIIDRKKSDAKADSQGDEE